MYIAVKPIHFDKWYQVGEEIPENVIHPSQRKRILASGRVACVGEELLSTLLPDNTILGEAATGEADDSAVLEEATLELPLDTKEEASEGVSPTEITEESTQEALDVSQEVASDEEPVEEIPEEALKKKTTKKAVRKPKNRGEPMTYSYDPRKIRGYGKDQMRFELGDTMVNDGENSSALCDEEYLAMLEGVTSGTWLQAKLDILSAILHKLAFQVDTKIDTLEYDFSTRVAQWETLYQALKEEKEESVTKHSVPSMAPMGKGHFFDGMHDNVSIFRG